MAVGRFRFRRFYKNGFLYIVFEWFFWKVGLGRGWRRGYGCIFLVGYSLVGIVFDFVLCFRCRVLFGSVIGY